MISTKVLYNLEEKETGKTIIKVAIEWFEADKKLLRKVAEDGNEIGIKLDEASILKDKDILFETDDKAYMVDIIPVEAITYHDHHHIHLVKFAYIVGNRHAPIFLSEGKLCIPYDQPMMIMLEKRGYKVVKETIKLTNPLEGHSHHEH